MKNWTSSPPIVPIDKREEKLVPRFHFAFPLKSNFNENTAILRPVPSKFLYFSPPRLRSTFHRRSIFHRTRSVNTSRPWRRGVKVEEERLGIAGISQLRLLHRALIAPGNFPTGFTALFSPVALECTLSPKGKRELRTNTLSLKREKEIYIYIGQRRRMKSQLVTPV